MVRFLQQDMDSETIFTVINLDQWIWSIQTESFNYDFHQPKL